MNKKLVALAVAGAFALPLAAQAQTANVTLYGRANLDLEFVKGAQPNGTNTTVTRVSSNSSRFGLRGVETISNNLSAFFQVENSVNWDGNPNQNGAGAAANIANRETFAGLQGSWGQVWMGRALSPYDDTTNIFANASLLNTGLLGSSNIWSNTSNGGGNPVSGSYDDRYSNSLRYNSPTFAGFNVEVQAATFENTGHAWAIIPGLFYNNGPISGGVAYASHNKLRCYATQTTGAYSACSAGANNGAVPPGGFAANDNAVTATGAYDFGIVKVSLAYEYLKYQTPQGDITRSFWQIGGQAPLGGGILYANYNKAGNGGGSAPPTCNATNPAASAPGCVLNRINSVGEGDNTTAYSWQVSYAYNLTKRTELYVGYIRINNGSNANYTFNVNGYSVTNGAKPQGLVLGFVHFF